MLLSLWIIACFCEALQNGAAAAAQREKGIAERYRVWSPGVYADVQLVDHPLSFFLHGVNRGSSRNGSGQTATAEPASSRKRRQTSIRTIDGRPRNPVSPTTCKCPTCNTTEITYQYDTFENVAYNKLATASSFLNRETPPCAATNAMREPRGDPYVSYISGADDQVPWLTIDFDYVVTIDHVVLYRWSTDDGAGQERLLGMDVLCDGRRYFTFPKYNQEIQVLPLYFKLKLRYPQTARYLTFQKQDDETGRTPNKYKIALNNVETWVCKPGTWGNQTAGCRVCPEVCNYFCDNRYGCRRVLYNVVLRKPAYARPQGVPGHGSPENVVDGRLAGKLPSTCFVLNANSPMELVWWVELGAVYRIYFFVLTSRLDCCGADSLKDFWVFVGRNAHRLNWWDNVNNTMLCNHMSAGLNSTNQRIRITCYKDRAGSMVAMASYTTAIMGFCEIEALGYHTYALKTGDRCNNESRNEYCKETIESGVWIYSVCEGSICKKGLNSTCTRNEECTSDALCDLNKCKSNYNSVCDPGMPTCRSRTFCEASSGRCKSKLGLINSCTSGQDDRCPSNAKCDNLGRCGLKPGQRCQETNQCTAGAMCQQGTCRCNAGFATLANDLCSPATGRIGSPCDVANPCRVGTCQGGFCTCQQNYAAHFSDFSCKPKAASACQFNDNCTVGLVCENSICHIVGGGSCEGNEQYCSSGYTCHEDICRVQTGEDCMGNEHLCLPGASCFSGKCKIELGENCQDSPQVCANGSCSDDNTCKLSATDACSFDTARFCEGGAICEDNRVCKTDLGQPCSSNKQCRGRTECVARSGSEEKCRTRMGDSGCTSDDECASDTVCDVLKFCSIPRGGSCQQSEDVSLCVAGAQCVDGECHCVYDSQDSSPTTCALLPGQVGGVCRDLEGGGHPCIDPWALCDQEKNVCVCGGEGFIPDHATLSCRLKPGGRCRTDNNCTKQATCETGVCSLKVGQSCAGERRGFCNTESVCDQKDQTCRLNHYQNCASYRTGCRENRTCDVLFRCKYGPGRDCREDSECAAGSHCSSQTSIGKCQCTDGVTTLRDGACVPNDELVGGSCQDSGTCEDENAFCKTDTKICECSAGFSGEPVKLTCAKVAGQPCVLDKECSTGMACDASNKTCRVQLGQLCDSDSKDECGTGLVCGFDNLCRLDLKGNCSGDKDALCKIGTFCDFLHQCSVGVGESCTPAEDGEEDPCVAGALCDVHECVCDPSVSNVYGSLCEPFEGRYGGTCDLACSVENSRCVAGVCSCQANFKPTRKFECEYTGGPTSSSTDTGVVVLIIVGVVCLLLLLTAAAVLFLRYKRKSAKMAMVSEQGKETRKQMEELKAQADEVLKQEQEQDKTWSGSMSSDVQSTTSEVSASQSGPLETEHSPMASADDTSAVSSSVVESSAMESSADMSSAAEASSLPQRESKVDFPMDQLPEMPSAAEAPQRESKVDLPLDQLHL